MSGVISTNPTSQKNIYSCGVDTQNDRIELEIVGWGQDEESWSIDYKIIYGNPSNIEVWQDLERILNEEEFRTQDNRVLRITATAIDTGGHHTEDVYKFCRDQNSKAKRVFAIKGKEFLSYILQNLVLGKIVCN